MNEEAQAPPEPEELAADGSPDAQATAGGFARWRRACLLALLTAGLLASVAVRYGFNVWLPAGGEFSGHAELGDADAPVVVDRRVLLSPPAQLIVARIPRGKGYRLGIGLTSSDPHRLVAIEAEAKRRGALVAINGDYHRLGDSACFGSPYSTFVEGQSWHALGSPFGYACSFWIDQSGQPHVGRLDLIGRVQLPDGPLDVHVNEELGAALLWLQPPLAWTVPPGRVALPLVHVGGRDSRRLRVRAELAQAGVALSGPALLAEEGAVATRLAGVGVGFVIRWTRAGKDAERVHLAVGTGPRLLEGGELAEVLKKPADSGWTIRVQRTAVGVSKDAVYFVATPQALRSGLSLKQLAKALLELGCEDAVNLDGGPSTSLWIRGQGVVTSPRASPKVATCVLALPRGEVGTPLR